MLTSLTESTEKCVTLGMADGKDKACEYEIEAATLLKWRKAVEAYNRAQLEMSAVVESRTMERKGAKH